MITEFVTEFGDKFGAEFVTKKHWAPTSFETQITKKYSTAMCCSLRRLVFTNEQISIIIPGDVDVAAKTFLAWVGWT